MPPGALDRMTDLCSGWRSGGMAVGSACAAGQGVPMQDCPPAPPAPAATPEPGTPSALCSRTGCAGGAASTCGRDDDGTFAIWAMFRDTVGEGGGAEVVLHEYTVTRVGADGVLAGRGRAPGAALPRVPRRGRGRGRPGRLAGAGAGVPVPDTLTGIASCTHLNDLLRALGGMADLLAPSGP